MSSGEKLSDDVKAHIVCALATYMAPSKVVLSVKEEFDVVVTRQQVQGYDPTKSQGRDLSPKYRAMFEAARKAWCEDVAAVGIGHPGFRLNEMMRMYAEVRLTANVVLAKAILEQAAEETDRLNGGAKGKKAAADDAGLLEPSDIDPERMAAAHRKFLTVVQGGKEQPKKKAV